VPDLSSDPVVNTTSTSVSSSVSFAESPAAMFSLFIPSDSVDCLTFANLCKPPFLGRKIPDFSEISPSVRGQSFLAFKDVKSKLGSSEKSQGRLK